MDLEIKISFTTCWREKVKSQLGCESDSDTVTAAGRLKFLRSAGASLSSTRKIPWRNIKECAKTDEALNHYKLIII